MTADIDLVRHVRTQKGVERYGLPIGTPLDGSSVEALNEKARGAWLAGDKAASSKYLTAATALKKSLAKDAVSTAQSKVNPDLRGLPNIKGVQLNGQNYDLDAAAKLVAQAYDWHNRDKEGAVKADKPSVYQQNKAQIAAKSWATAVTGDSPDDDQYASSLWDEYQNPGLYGKINGVLRGTSKPERGDPSKADLAKYVNAMFVKGGWTTTEPMTVFRALKSARASTFEPGDDSGTQNWSTQLSAGTTFTDMGIVSGTAHSKFARGWLEHGAQGGAASRTVTKDDVVVELRLPAGQRIMGGDPQFIETMLPPGTTFKVVSKTVKEDVLAVSPLDHTKEKVTYTHVVAEVVPE